MPQNAEFAKMSTVKANKASNLRKYSGGKISYKQREMKKLDIDNKQMEWRLHQLRQTMEEEKKGRSQIGNIWESANKHNTNLPTKANPGSKNSKIRPKTEGTRKVVVLKDEPVEMPKRRSNYTNLIEKLSREDATLSEKSSKSIPNVTESKQAWIAIAKNRNSEEVVDIQSDLDGNLPLSSIQSINPNAIGLFFVKWGRKRILPAVDGNVIRPKAGWGTDTYYPYISSINWQQNTPAVNYKLTNKPESPKIPKTPDSERRQKKMTDSSPTGGVLLQGNFSEEESAKSFQVALQQWRQNSKTDLTAVRKEFRETAVHAVQSDPVEIEINFSEMTTLTPQEKEMLEAHRSSSIPPLSTLPTNLQRGDYFDDDLQTYHTLTEEMREERERIRNLFESGIPTRSDENFQSSIVFTEVEDDLDDSLISNEQTSNCIVEAPNENPKQLNNRPQSSVTIKEFDYSVENEPKPTNHDVNTTTNVPIPSAKIEGLTLAKKESLLSAVASLSVDPKAVYNHQNLGQFFTGHSSEEMVEKIEGENKVRNRKLLLKTQNVQSWQPSTSVVSDDNTFATNNSYKLEGGKEIETLEEIEKVIEREKEDQEHLQNLEWELASQTGNITKDGRISRLIDEWPSDDDDAKLGIINDPGTSSGLTTPDVDRFKWADHFPVADTQHTSSTDEYVMKSWSAPGNATFQKIENYMIGGIDDSDENN